MGSAGPPPNLRCWKTITQASHTIAAGDLVAIRGKGRLEIGDVAVTKKERYRINLIRYV